MNNITEISNSNNNNSNNNNNNENSSYEQGLKNPMFTKIKSEKKLSLIGKSSKLNNLARSNTQTDLNKQIIDKKTKNKNLNLYKFEQN